MRFPPVRYVPTGNATYLELHCWDGTCRGVVFVDAQAADAARRGGRAEFDRLAIDGGFLPRGAFLVSRATARNAHELIVETWDTNDDELAEHLQPLIDRHAAATDYVTQESDAAARLRDPTGADNYDRLIDGTAKRPIPDDATA